MRRLILFLFLFTALVGICLAQQGSQEDVVTKLLPNHYPQKLPGLNPAESKKVISQLQSAQRKATGMRAQEVTFLLAAYNSDYQKNRDYLVHVLRGCATHSVQFGCDEITGAFLEALYQRGHKDVLKPLMLYGKDSYNASLAELLGDFCSRVLANHTDEFLGAIRSMTPKDQRKVCEFAGSADGGGMNPKNLQQVRKNLKRINDDLALRCLRAVELGSKPE